MRQGNREGTPLRLRDRNPRVKAMAVRLVPGNTDAVLACIEHSSEGCFLTGSEDGWVRVLDARSERGACSGWSCEWGPVGCVAARGPRHPHLFLAGSGSSLIEIDGRMSSDGGAHSCVREVYRCGEWGRGPPPGGDAEINAVAVHANGSLAAIADDDGVISIVKERQGSSGWDLERRVRPGHANIASAVAFAPHRPWCLLSGGLDCFLGCWDASTGKAKVLHNVGQGGGDGPDGDAGRVFNPPLVHGIATLPDDTPRPFARLVAAARGDGVVGLYDADAMWQPRGSREPSSSSQEASGAGPQGPRSTSTPDTDRQESGVLSEGDSGRAREVLGADVLAAVMARAAGGEGGEWGGGATLRAVNWLWGVPTALDARHARVADLRGWAAKAGCGATGCKARDAAGAAQAPDGATSHTAACVRAVKGAEGAARRAPLRSQRQGDVGTGTGPLLALLGRGNADSGLSGGHTGPVSSVDFWPPSLGALLLSGAMDGTALAWDLEKAFRDGEPMTAAEGLQPSLHVALGQKVNCLRCCRWRAQAAVGGTTPQLALIDIARA